MNLKVSVFSAGVLFFLGQVVSAQTKSDSLTKEKQIEEVVVQGYKTVTKKTAVTSTASINSETIENRPNANVMNIVQGQLAGVNITANSGQPGAKPVVVIRGVGSYGGNTDPLYVIDGFPSNSDSFRSINSNDIESIQVLKDATSLSEFGSRGSNGVIVIKTKQGKYGEGRLNVSFSSQFGVSYLQKQKYNFSNAKELLTLQNRLGAGVGASMSQDQIDNYEVNTNWVDYFFKPSVLSSHTIGIETGGKNFNSYTSVGYLDQDGMLQTTGLKRFTVRSNINGKSNNNKLKYYLGMSAGFSKNREADGLGGPGVNQNMVLGAMTGAPFVSPSLYQNSSQLHQLYTSNGTLLYSPLMLIDKMNQYNNLTDETRIDVTAEVSYKIQKDLTARMRINAQVLNTRFTQATFPNSFNAFIFGSGREFNGTENFDIRREFTYNNLVGLNYNKKVGDHTFSLDGYLEYNFANLQVNSMTQNGLNPKTFVPDTGAGYIGDVVANDFYVPVVSSTQLRYNMISYFGSFDYDYKKKYGFVATARRDGTSRFLNDLQWGTFWSLGARWNISEENFLKDISFINDLKIRGSIGTVGNQRVAQGTVFAGLNPPRFADIFSIPTAASSTYNGGQIYNISFGDEKLRWETTKTYNIGLDWELFNRRLKGSFDYYNKKTIDLFMQDPTSPVFGTTGITKNTDATIINKGFELNIGFDVIKTDNTLLTLRANGSMNEQVFDDYSMGLLNTGSDPTFSSVNGNIPFLPFVYHYIGVNPANGNLLFEDFNGNATENPTNADRKLYKYSNLPKFQGGFGFDFDWKGFFANTTFTFVSKVARRDVDLENAMSVSALSAFNVSKDLLNAWTPTNTDSNIPSLRATNFAAQSNSDRFLVNASYLRLRNIQVGYRVPKRLLAGTFINDLSITLQAENLYTWTDWKGFDPESSRNTDRSEYPTPRTFTLGFNVKF